MLSWLLSDPTPTYILIKAQPPPPYLFRFSGDKIADFNCFVWRQTFNFNLGLDLKTPVDIDWYWLIDGSLRSVFIKTRFNIVSITIDILLLLKGIHPSSYLRYPDPCHCETFDPCTALSNGSVSSLLSQNDFYNLFYCCIFPFCQFKCSKPESFFWLDCCYSGTYSALHSASLANTTNYIGCKQLLSYYFAIEKRYCCHGKGCKICLLWKSCRWKFWLCYAFWTHYLCSCC